MKLLLAALVLSITVFAQNFSTRQMPGVWELSSSKLNRTVSFGKDLGKERNGMWRLLFNPQGKLKVEDTGSVYNYEIINGQLKIYETKVYRNNYKVKNKNRYDLMKIVGNYEGCYLVKIVKKKIPGYKSRYDLKMCKVENYPQPVVQPSVSDYKF